MYNSPAHISARGGSNYANLFLSIIFPVFHNHKDTSYMLNITFIFDRCRHSLAVATPVKYECDSNNLPVTWGRQKKIHDTN